MTSNLINDFMILGPAMSSGKKVLEAVHALYYLPDNFKLILTGSQNASRSFYKEVVSLARRNELAHRVQFDGYHYDPHAVILPNTGKSRAANTVTGDSPEALASAILDIARA